MKTQDENIAARGDLQDPKTYEVIVNPPTTKADLIEGQKKENVKSQDDIEEEKRQKQLRRELAAKYNARADAEKAEAERQKKLR